MDEFIYSLLSYRDYMRFVKPSSSPKEYGIFLINRRKKRNSKKIKKVGVLWLIK